MFIRVFPRKLVFESVDWLKKITSAIQMGIIQSVKGLTSQKAEKWWLCSLLELDIQLLLPSNINSPGSWAFRLRQQLCTIGSPGSQAFPSSELHFPGPPPWREQIVELLSLRNHMSQSPMINPSPWSCSPTCFVKRPHLTTASYNLKSRKLTKYKMLPVKYQSSGSQL